MAGVVAFMGPFGTYGMGPWLDRFWHWWALMTGAWATMRPMMLGWRWLAWRTRLPASAIVFWGMVLAAIPLAQVWRWSSPPQERLLGGYAGLLSFTLLCAAAVGAVAWWAGKAEAYLAQFARPEASGAAAGGDKAADAPALAADRTGQTRLRARLGQFDGPILALQSEDHYVRVHGEGHSELLLMRLRDAIVEMDGVPGVQTHRSWWVARAAIAEAVTAGTKQEVRLVNGLSVPIARGAAERLRERQG
ncbi:MAG: LytTR family transcriptional regulator [Sphingomonadales bacterium]|nr:LytTR family transcriptional regulator [Sphingomonadales bacterium]